MLASLFCLFGSGCNILLILSLSNLNCSTVLTWLIVDLTTCLDDLFKLIITISDMLKELSVDLSQLGSLLCCKLVFVDLLLDGLLKLLSLALCSV